MGSDKQILDSGSLWRGREGNGIGEGYSGCFSCVCNVQKNLKDNKMFKFDKAGWWISQIFFIFFLVFSMFLIFYNLKFFLPQKEKMCWVVRPYSEWSLTNLLLEFVLYQCQLSFAAISMSALVPHTYKFEFAYLLVRKPGFEAFLEVHIT